MERGSVTWTIGFRSLIDVDQTNCSSRNRHAGWRTFAVWHLQLGPLRLVHSDVGLRVHLCHM